MGFTGENDPNTSSWGMVQMNNYTAEAKRFVPMNSQHVFGSGIFGAGNSTSFRKRVHIIRLCANMQTNSGTVVGPLFGISDGTTDTEFDYGVGVTGLETADVDTNFNPDVPWSMIHDTTGQTTTVLTGYYSVEWE